MAENLTVYEISFTWNDGCNGSMIVKGLKKKNSCIKNMLYIESYKSIEFQSIYKSGKRGDIIKVL